MKERQTTVFVARDGTQFSVAAECKAYEADNLPTMLALATTAEMKAAFERQDTELADLLELAGDRIRRDRLAAGDRKRGRKGEADKPADGPSEPTADPVEAEGEKAFMAGFPGIIPDDLTPAEGQRWLTGWDRKSVARAQRTEVAA
jgi:hypothetical protein